VFGFMAGWLTVSLLSVSRDSECRPRPAGTGQLAPFSAVPLNHPCFGTARSEERKKRKKTGADNPCAERYRDRARGARLGGSVESRHPSGRKMQDLRSISRGAKCAVGNTRRAGKARRPARQIRQAKAASTAAWALSPEEGSNDEHHSNTHALLCTAPSHIAYRTRTATTTNTKATAAPSSHTALRASSP
jgi:hypothetical protein